LPARCCTFTARRPVPILIRGASCRNLATCRRGDQVSAADQRRFRHDRFARCSLSPVIKRNPPGTGIAGAGGAGRDREGRAAEGGEPGPLGQTRARARLHALSGSRALSTSGSVFRAVRKRNRVVNGQRERASRAGHRARDAPDRRRRRVPRCWPTSRLSTPSRTCGGVLVSGPGSRRAIRANRPNPRHRGSLGVPKPDAGALGSEAGISGSESNPLDLSG
jgi:hypothetical protein